MKPSTFALRVAMVLGGIPFVAIGALAFVTLLGLVGQQIIGHSSLTAAQFVYVDVWRTTEPLWQVGLKTLSILAMFGAMAGALYCMAQAIWLALQLVWAVVRTLPIVRRH